MAQDRRSVGFFISSTFRDMHAERDHLISVVMPELRERLERLGLEFYDVDLRWGVPQTGVDGERANSWAYCKRLIDRVEPFFVCILGERYGWQPPAEEIPDPHDRAAYNGMSITEMEIRYAVLSKQLHRRSFFYLRKPTVPSSMPADVYIEFVDATERVHLANLKEEIRHTGRPVRDYDCQWTGREFNQLDEFGRMVLEDVWSGVLRDPQFVQKEAWRDALGHDPDFDPVYTDEEHPIPADIADKVVARAKPSPLDPYDAEARQMDAFAATRLRWFQGRQKELADLESFINDDLLTEDSRVCVVHGATGQGKSALLAKLAENLQHSDHLLITHFVGATERSGDLYSLLTRLEAELDRSHIIWPADEDDRQDTESVRKRLARRLKEYSGDRRIVLVIDSVNQLTDGHDLMWLPDKLAPNVRILLSCIDDPASPPDSPEARVLSALRARPHEPGWLLLSPLRKTDVRQIVVNCLLEYCKELDRNEIITICLTPQARNPLYLLVMLHELRTLGGNDMHRIVPALIKELRKNHRDAVSLFNWVLERLEVFGVEEVKLWFTYLALGRAGMSSSELSDLLARKLGPDAGRKSWLIERGIRRYLHHRGHLLDFFHGQLREAVMHRYVIGDATDHHADIVAYLETRWRELETHAISELPYHQVQGELWDALYNTLNGPTFRQQKIKYFGVQSLLEDATLAVRAACAKAQIYSSEKIIRFALLYDRLRNMLPGAANIVLQFAANRDYMACVRRIREANHHARFNLALIVAWQAAINKDFEQAEMFSSESLPTAHIGVTSTNHGLILAAVRFLTECGLPAAIDLLTSDFLLRRFIELEKETLKKPDSRFLREKLETKISEVVDTAYDRSLLRTSLAATFEAAGETERARTLLRLALEEANTLADSYQKARVLCGLLKSAVVLSDKELWSSLQTKIMNLPDDEWRVCALCELAAAVIKKGDEAPSLELVVSLVMPAYASVKQAVESEPSKLPVDHESHSLSAAAQFLNRTFFGRNLQWLPESLGEVTVALAAYPSERSREVCDWVQHLAHEAAARAGGDRENRDLSFQFNFLLEFATKLHRLGFTDRALNTISEAHALVGQLSDAVSQSSFVHHVVALAKTAAEAGDTDLLNRLPVLLYNFSEDASDAHLMVAIASALAAVGDTAASQKLFLQTIKASIVSDADECARRLADVSDGLGESFTVKQAPAIYDELRKEVLRIAELSDLASNTCLTALAKALHNSGDSVGCQELFSQALNEATRPAVRTEYRLNEIIDAIERCYSPNYGPALSAAIVDSIPRATFPVTNPPSYNNVQELFRDAGFIAGPGSENHVKPQIEIYSAIAARAEELCEEGKRERILTELKQRVRASDSDEDRLHFFSQLGRAAVLAGRHDEAQEAFIVAVECAGTGSWSARNFEQVIAALAESNSNGTPSPWIEPVYRKLQMQIGKYKEPWSARLFASVAFQLKRTRQRWMSLEAAWRALRTTRLLESEFERNELRVAIANDLHKAVGGWLSWILLWRAERYFLRQREERRKYENLMKVLDGWLLTDRPKRAHRLRDTLSAPLQRDKTLLPASVFAHMIIVQAHQLGNSDFLSNFLDGMAANPMQQYEEQKYALVESMITAVNSENDPEWQLRTRRQLLSKLSSLIPELRLRLPLESTLLCIMALTDPEAALRAIHENDSIQTRQEIIPKMAAEICKYQLSHAHWKLLLALVGESLARRQALYWILASLLRVTRKAEHAAVTDLLLQV
jgi:tetratricopeptide (TPR) repeat protein